ncbi:MULTISPECIES: hypothetical protein [Cyanophyceae]|uniref:hypothetical protein n=1 Tax=Cyanophyceae TaxID=3028117 RepID=UPI001682E3C8|nr:hypothetical protein [Trichocoleus sp. FACHB-40]MBD2005927.1 hypothetical protein [Trichocoleus sp. FACHB-40]
MLLAMAMAVELFFGQIRRQIFPEILAAKAAPSPVTADLLRIWEGQSSFCPSPYN